MNEDSRSTGHHNTAGSWSELNQALIDIYMMSGQWSAYLGRQESIGPDIAVISDYKQNFKMYNFKHRWC